MESRSFWPRTSCLLCVRSCFSLNCTDHVLYDPFLSVAGSYSLPRHLALDNLVVFKYFLFCCYFIP